MKLEIYNKNHNYIGFRFQERITGLLDNFGWVGSFNQNRLEIYYR
jgi:hypothetical protein